ncbi:MAG: acyltransferase family protein [Pseudomonadota bacterium]|nr:acyltransferase family protein [Pseudomonadota bacterium]
MKKETYIPEMQAARGVGIILVALGHGEPVREAYPQLFSWIYSFHMPLFFLLSGFFSSRLARDGPAVEAVKTSLRRAFNLFIPYLSVSIGYSAMKYFASALAKRPVSLANLPQDILLYPGNNPALFLWFIHALMIMWLLAPLLSRMPAVLLAPLLVLSQMHSPDARIFGLGNVFHFLIYYYLGLLAAAKREEFLAVMGRWTTCGAALGLFAAGYLLTLGRGVPGLSFLIAVAGSIWVVSSCFACKKRLPMQFLEACGKRSLQIYLLQYFFIFPLYLLLKSRGVDGEWIVPLTFCAGLLLPLVLCRWVFPHFATLAFLIGGCDLEGQEGIRPQNTF